MFIVYEVPGKKVGLSKQVEKRVKEQGFTEYKIVEICLTEEEGSERERYWQKRLGYPVDPTSYKTFMASTQNAKAKAKRIASFLESTKNCEKYQAFLKEKAKSMHTEEVNEKRKASFKTSKARKLASEKCHIPVLQYTKEGVYIREWSCGNEVKKTLGINNLASCLKGRLQTTGGFIWKYKVI
jgi:hypothetical protein